MYHPDKGIVKDGYCFNRIKIVFDNGSSLSNAVTGFANNNQPSSLSKKHDLNDKLYYAAREGDFEEVKRLVEKGADADQNSVRAPLYSAAILGHLKVVKYLASKGANVDVAPYLSWFFQTAGNGHLEVVKFLVETAFGITNLIVKVLLKMRLIGLNLNVLNLTMLSNI